MSKKISLNIQPFSLSSLRQLIKKGGIVKCEVCGVEDSFVRLMLITNTDGKNQCIQCSANQDGVQFVKESFK